MKTELQDKLLKKYPQFFTTEREIYIGKKPMKQELHELLNQEKIVLPIQFGFECGNGWYMLLDELMAEIQNHITNVNRNNTNEFEYKWVKNLSFYLRIKISAKHKILHAIGEWMYKHAYRKDLPPMIIQIDQIKEKFGGLRFYYHGGDKTIDGMVSLAESLSYKICESCGTTKGVGQTGGWIYTVCWDCLQKNPRANDLKWKPNEE